MFEHPVNPPRPSEPQQGLRIIAEAVLVAVIGAALALLANQLSPRGLELARNYFPGDSRTNKPVPVATGNATSTNVGATPASGSTNSGTNALAKKLQAEGLHLLDRAQAGQLFHDPRVQENLVVFVDARGEDDYAKGHIPGAFEFYPYYPAKYLTNVLPPCQIAEKIVVYCTGGDCEDSQSAALFLRDSGIPPEKLFVFAGGMTEWEAGKLPVETGVRNSGDIRPAQP